MVRFADKDRHLLFLEPEGLNTDEVYVNGLSTSLPSDVQELVVRSIPAWRMPSCCATATPWNTTAFRRGKFTAIWKPSWCRGCI